MAANGSEASGKQQGGEFVTYEPTRLQAFWRRLGFRRHPGDPISLADFDQARGSIRSVWGVHLHFRDRLRILISGHLRVETLLYTDVNVKKVTSCVDWEIVEPGGMR